MLFLTSKGLENLERARSSNRWGSYTTYMALRSSECVHLFCHSCLAYKLLGVRKASDRRSNKNYSVWTSCVNLRLCFISRREKRQKIEDIKKNIRDAILVSKTSLFTIYHPHLARGSLRFHIFFRFISLLYFCKIPNSCFLDHNRGYADANSAGEVSQP